MLISAPASTEKPPRPSPQPSDGTTTSRTPRRSAPPRTTLITAQRLGSTTRTAFELWRYYANDGSTDPVVVQLPNGSSGALYAATATGAVLYEAGCWRVEIANADAVTIPVR